MHGKVLSIATTDSSGGAGIQADIKTVTALGGYAASVIVALTAQNTQEVSGIYDLPPDFIHLQFKAVMTDIGADAIKIGMLHRRRTIESVDAALTLYAPKTRVVLDPVMVAESGAQLLEDDAVAALRDVFQKWSYLITPNVPEAEKLSGLSITSTNDMEAAARVLQEKGYGNVLVKGGHLGGGRIEDILVTQQGHVKRFTSPRIESRQTHGTGCTLASAIATGLAQGMALEPAVMRARAYLFEAIRTAPGYGKGNGPVNHSHTVKDFTGKGVIPDA